MKSSEYYEEQLHSPTIKLSKDDAITFISEQKSRILTDCNFNKDKNIDCYGQLKYDYENSIVDPFEVKNELSKVSRLEGTYRHRKIEWYDYYSSNRKNLATFKKLCLEECQKK